MDKYAATEASTLTDRQNKQINILVMVKLDSFSLLIPASRYVQINNVQLIGKLLRNLNNK